MAKKQRTCVVCGAQYDYCPVCGADKSKPTWYMACCSEDCHTTVTAIADYVNKVITLEEAKAIISGVNKNKLATMTKYTEIIKEILGKNKKKKVVEDVETTEE